MNLNSMQMLLAVVMIISVIVLGASLFNYLETDWTYLESVYFVVSTAFTVGYGDMVPSPENRVITGFFIIGACVVTLASSAILGNGIITSIQRRVTIHENNDIIISGIKEEADDLKEHGLDIPDSSFDELRSILNEIDRKHRKSKNLRR